MRNQHISALMTRPGKAVTPETGPAVTPGPLELNVLFTGMDSTAAALECAESLARDLRASIHLHAAIAVPFQLPLEEPEVSVLFLQEKLRTLVAGMERERFQPKIHLYLCRDERRAISQVLKPNSLVVIGGRKHWWPTKESRMANALQSKGHRVIFVDSKARSASEPAVLAR